MKDLFENTPYIAILRGILPEEVLNFAKILLDLHFPIIEVPLNSPEPLESIRLLSETYGSQIVIGAGTVTQTAQVEDVAQAGGKIIVMPHCDEKIIKRAKQLGLYCAPGFSTISEAFTALKAGADLLKFFPAESLNSNLLKDWKAVLPQEALIVPVGGITPHNMAPYWKMGVVGFGLGSALYTAGMELHQFHQNACDFIRALS